MAKLKKIHFSSVSNVGRGFINPVLITIVSYLLIRQGLKADLLEINRINAVINAFIIFCGWGLKDFLLKENFQTPHSFIQKWNYALYSKLPLVVISCLICFFLPLNLARLICAFIIIRTVNSLFDSTIIYRKKIGLIFLYDSAVAGFIIALMGFHYIKNYYLFFYIILVSEAVKAIFLVSFFRLIRLNYFSLQNAFGFLAETKFFFLLSIVSFFQSKIDFYILGFLFKPESLNEYQVKMSLISFSQIATASFVTVYSKLFFKDIYSSERVFKTIVIKSGIVIAIISAFVMYVIENYFFGFSFNPVNTCIAISNVFIFGFVLTEMYYFTKLDKVKLVIPAILISGFVNALFSFLLVKQINITGGLLSNTLASLVLFLFLYFRRKKLSEDTNKHF